MKYTAQVCQAYPCSEKCEEVLDKLELLKDVLVHEIRANEAFTSSCEEIFGKYEESWYKIQELFQEIYDVDNLILWRLNQFGGYTLYETTFTVDDVYFISDANIATSDDMEDPFKNMKFTIINIDELNSVGQVI